MRSGSIRCVEYLDECQSCNGTRKFFLNRDGIEVFKRQDWRPDGFRLGYRETRANCRAVFIERTKKLKTKTVGKDHNVVQFRPAVGV